MMYKPFWPGDKVQVIFDYDGISSGTVGNIITRWMGIVYLIQLDDGTFRWISDRSFAPMYPERHRLQEGEFGVITTNERVKFAPVGEVLRVHKVIDPVDYYAVIIDHETKWLTGFQLCKYI